MEKKKQIGSQKKLPTNEQNSVGLDVAWIIQRRQRYKRPAGFECGSVHKLICCDSVQVYSYTQRKAETLL